MRVELEPADLPGRAFYRLINSIVVPRPIAWVSSLSAEGVPNLAPHSFYSVSCVDPPVIQFTSVGRKDSLRNVEATGEFVVNLSPEWLLEEVNATATDFPPEGDEFAEVGLEREPSTHVAPARVAGSPAALECRLRDTVSFGDSTVVFGDVLCAAIDEKVMVDGHPEIERLKPLSRLGRNEWGLIGEVRRIDRIKHDDWPGHYGDGD